MTLLSFALLLVWVPGAEIASTDVPRWGRFETVVRNDRSYGNPFTDVVLNATFTSPEWKTGGLLRFSRRRRPGWTDRQRLEAPLHAGRDRRLVVPIVPLATALPAPTGRSAASPPEPCPVRCASIPRIAAAGSLPMAPTFPPGRTRRRNCSSRAMRPSGSSGSTHFFGGKYKFNLCNANLLNFVGDRGRPQLAGNSLQGPRPGAARQVRAHWRQWTVSLSLLRAAAAVRRRVERGLAATERPLLGERRSGAGRVGGPQGGVVQPLGNDRVGLERQRQAPGAGRRPQAGAAVLDRPAGAVLERDLESRRGMGRIADAGRVRRTGQLHQTNRPVEPPQ